MTLPAYILRCKKQADKVNLLVKYCRELDGTELIVLDLPNEIDKIPHPIGVEHAIRWAAAQIKHPWIYLEADSIPTKPQWREAITAEYYAVGKPYMLPSLEGRPFYDVASAIGVFPADAAERLGPAPNKPPYFDLMIYQDQKEDVHFTRIIQHAYGLYEGCRVVRRHSFPQDREMLRPDAVIFHADPTQSIIRGGLLQTYHHSGDVGDVIAALPIIKQQGGGNLTIGPCSRVTPGKCPRQGINHARFTILQPLLRLQPYIQNLEYLPRYKTADRDFSQFRHTPRQLGENLIAWQSRATIGRIEICEEPWLEIGDYNQHNRVIVSRSARYQNPKFPWKEIGAKYRERLLFVGLPDEHRALERVMGRKLERASTSNFLDVARVIAGSEMGFYNQSSPFWIAAALGKTIVQETWMTEDNSLIRRPGMSYITTPEELETLKNDLQTDALPLPSSS